MPAELATSRRSLNGKCRGHPRAALSANCLESSGEMAERGQRVRGLLIHRPIVYGNTAIVLTPIERESLSTPDHTHRWTVAVRSAASPPGADMVGGGDDLTYFIKRVTFKLHDTYTNPTRHIDKPPFEVSETGWGEFDIQIRIQFIPEAVEKPVVFYHHLKLHPWTPHVLGAPSAPLPPPPLEEAARMGPVHSWQYDEIVFHEPYQAFLDILTDHPPTPLPKARNRVVPFHVVPEPGLNAGGAGTGGVPEFTTTMEKEEYDRLENAKKQILAEQEHWKKLLLEKEKEFQKLQKQIDA
ncbi:yeats-domain-containing protein [Coniophora puteana RWD-64-598 SS2]|uniref:Protein AF-9 homolog n=1 Tax=Coniophora puteana (strain RWD-64-598) TaxID=741705 RepID=A0A5M3MAH7_CONPW|nr:yeats-domain-containing protein [Coniophora puteana RWD-64-598 SS2]EIW76219.1 yeats-domain-containing protein [Coniophora puteana RWD-64-598 SS2]